MSVDYTLWDDVSKKLKESKYPKRYINPERYLADNPLENLVVPQDITNFFGTKVCNIFIVGVPYGWTKDSGTWTDHWPPIGYEDAKQRHKATFEKYTWYETHVYMDMHIVDLVMIDNPKSRFRDMMNATKTHMQEMCSDLADFGFIMESDITNEVDAEFFKPIIDAFIAATV